MKRGRELLDFCRSVLLSVKNNPQLFAFLNNRLDRNRFSGLPLTLLGIAFTYTLLLLFGIIEDVMTLDPIVAVDTRIDNLLQFYRDPLLVKAFLWITLLGKVEIVLSLAALCTLLFRLWRKQAYILPFWTTIGGSGIFNLIGKVAFHRQRPPGIEMYTEASFSFPSGHAVLAAALYGFIIYFLWRQAESWRTRLTILFAGSMLIVAIGFSRLYLGVHFLSDVLGGYLLGLLWLIIGICIVEWRFFEAPRQARAGSTSGTRALTAIFILAELVFYVHSGIHYNPVRHVFESQEVKVIGSEIVNGLSRYKLPRYTETISGEQQEPLNVIIVVRDDAALRHALETAGWKAADPVSFSSLAKTAKALLFNENYPTAPMTPSFWNGRVNELVFEKPTLRQTVRQRHHVRFWRTNLATGDNKRVYVGMTSFDVGMKWGLMRKISPDIDTERENLFRDLLDGKVIDSYTKTKFVKPGSGRNFTGDIFFTDGNLYTVDIR